MKERAESYEGTPSKILKDYKKDLNVFSKRAFEKSSIVDIFKAIEKSEIIYLGDFHTFDQSTRNLERIIRSMVKNKEEVILGVEFIGFENQHRIDDYLKHHLTELEFLEEIDYKESWRFPWNHYKFLFEMAKENKYKVIGLNSEGNLIDRDSFAANLLVQAHKNNPKAKIFVLFGELHIAPDKLPSKVTSLRQEPIEQLIIHQNLDEVFWNFQKDQKLASEPPQIVKFTDNEFSIQTSPPWIKYESQIYWYEHLMEDPDFDIHEYIMETGFKVFHGGTQENFLFIIREIIRVLNLKGFENDDLEDFNLLDHTDFDLIIEKIDEYKLKGLKSHLKKLLLEGSPFKLPFQNYYYCSSYSINRLAYLAGVKIQNLFLEKREITEESILSGTQTEKFFFYLQLNFIAYFSSKIINPFRKCNLYGDFKIIAKNNQSPEALVKDLELVFAILEGESFNEDKINSLPLNQIFSSAKSIGYIMADSFYEHFFKKSFKDFSSILHTVLNLDYDVKSYLHLKRILLDQFDFKSQKKRFF